jgi:hypothetical protein
MRLARVFSAILCLLALTSCGRHGDDADGKLPFSHRFEFTLDGNPIEIRIAIRNEEQKDGLMWIESMPADEGMLFVFEFPKQMSFWMRNTRIPLDIGYFDTAGVLREIYPMYPNVEDPILSRSRDIRYALEMNQGWYKAHQVGPGAQLDLNTLRNAVRDRGFDSDVFVDPR